MPGGEVVDPPHSLKTTEVCDVDQVVNFSALNPLFYAINFYCVASFEQVSIHALLSLLRVTKVLSTLVYKL